MKKRIVVLMIAMTMLLVMPLTAFGEPGSGVPPPYPPLIEPRIALPDFDCD